MRNQWNCSVRQGLLTGVSVACIAAALATAGQAVAADKYFASSASGVNMNSGNGGFNLLVGPTDRAVYNAAVAGTSTLWTNKTIDGILVEAPYTGAVFARSLLAGEGVLTLAGSTGIGIESHVDREINILNKVALGASQEWRLDSTIGSLRQLTNRTADFNLNLNARILTLNAINAGNSFYLGTPITGTGSLAIQGLGTTFLSGANLFTGGIALNGGRLSVASGANLGDAAGPLTFGGGELEITGTSFAASARGVTLGAAGGAIKVSDAGADVTFSGVMGGAGGLTKRGDGALTLSGVNTFTGDTVVEAGVLALDGVGALGGSRVQGDSVFDISGATNAQVKSLAGDGMVRLGARTLTLTAAGDDFGGLIEGTGGLTLDGGTQTLSGDNTYIGATIVNGGVLRINGDQSAATGLTTVKTGGALGGSGTVGGDVLVEDGGKLAPGNSPGTLTILGDLTLDPAAVLDFEFGHSNVVGGPMNDLVKVGGDLRLDGTVNVTLTAGGVFDTGLYRIASYGGGLDNQGLSIGTTPGGVPVTVQTVIPGQVNLVNTGGLTVNFWDGDAPGGSGNSRVDGGGGTWTGASGNWTTGTGAVNNTYTPGDFLIFAAAPGTVNVGTVTTSGGLQFAVDGYRLTGGTITLSSAGRTFRVGDGTADGKNYVTTIDSRLIGAGGGITKTDLGTLILSGANTYSGVTDVQAGTLLFNGSMAGSGSALVVGANGTVGGTSRSRGGAISGTLAPGGLTTPGTLTFNGPLTLNSGATLRYRLGQADTPGGALNDLAVVNGALTLDGTLNVTQSAGGSFLQGVYRLINYSGILTDNGLDVGTLPTGFTGVIQTSIAKEVNLIASAVPTPPPEFVFWDGDAGAAGDGAVSGGDGVWRAASGNWTTASGAQNGAFSNPRFAIFAGSAGTVRLDGSSGPIEVSGAQFAADGYRLTGDALHLGAGENIIRVGDGTNAGAQFQATLDVAVTGAGGLNKADGGTLTLTGENTYAGGTRVSGGTLRVGAGGTSGSILGDVVVGGALVFERSDDVAFSGVISGAGTLVQAGAGKTTLIADSSAFAGRTEVRTGALAVDGALGGTLEVLAGTRLEGTGQVGSTTNRGLIGPGHSIGTLTIAGDYVGDGGGLEIEATLGDDRSAADRLVVTGATHGESAVSIVRRGGVGAATVAGIRVIEVGGASNGVFTLANPDYVIEGRRALIAGAYGYVLAKDDGGWSLRSSLPAQPAPPATPVTPSTPEVTLYQPGVPVYEALPRVLNALSGVGTLRQRTGERQWSGEEGASVWGRLEGRHLHAEPKASASLSDLDVDSWKMQFGVERALGEAMAGGQLVGGLTAHYGEGTAEVGSRFGDGDIDTKAYGVGATLTWYGAGGGYLDAQAQASWFDSDLTSDLLGRRADGVGGQGYGLSLEAGRAFAAGGGLSLTPQAQITYSSNDFDSFVDPLETAVSAGEGESLQARAGLALDHRRSWQDAGGQTRSLRLYGLANFSYEFLDGTSARVAGVSVGGRDERLRGGLALGGGYDFGRYSLFGEAAADTSLSGFGDSYGFNGSAGFRMRF